MKQEDLLWDKISLNNAAKNFFDSLIPDIYDDILIIGISRLTEKKSFILLSDKEDTIDFSGVFFLGNELYKSSPESKLCHTDPNCHERYHKRAKNKYISKSIRQYVQDFYNKNVVITSNFFDIPEDEDNLYVLGVKLNKDIYNCYRKITFEDLYRIQHCESIVDVATDVFLRNAVLCFKNQIYDSLKDIEYLKKQTGNEFFYIVSLKGNIEGINSVFNNINLISQMKYESSEAAGNLIISKERSDIKYELEFSERYSLSNIRLIRKLLELTNDDLFLITDGAYVYGVGKKKKRDSLSDDLYKIKINGNYSWSLFSNDILILNYDFGIPKIPQTPLDKNIFIKKIKRCFKLISDINIEKIYDCVLSLINQRKGAVLVISSKAQKESKRLGKQGIMIKPTNLNKKIIEKLSSIDGAILINKRCKCFAVGIILDGISLGNGTSERGSRYNSSLRYCEWRRKKYNEDVAVVVISEDGMINLLPELKDYVQRKDLDDVLNDYLSINENTEIKKIYSIMDLIFNKYKYYFNQDQCIIINNKKEEIYKILERERGSYLLYEDMHQYEEFDENLIKN